MRRKKRRERECVKLAWKVLVLWQQKSHKKGKHLCWVRKLSRPPGPGKTQETTPKKRKGGKKSGTERRRRSGQRPVDGLEHYAQKYLCSGSTSDLFTS